MLGVLLNGK
ncbi:uncharacterized protein FTOL_13275 [Fusarium torulosum]|uniref:Uncharacterized protein n=1 Tax=Fusarium torulosum TaxID=33205 RepID=A0AAE8SQ50_9HYPO|nr:uncharacterized protein FTOL_13275 [Fusarium torulosum]